MGLRSGIPGVSKLTRISHVVMDVMKKALRKASFGTEGTTEQKYEGTISDSLLVEKNGRPEERN